MASSVCSLHPPAAEGDVKRSPGWGRCLRAPTPPRSSFYSLSQDQGLKTLRQAGVTRGNREDAVCRIQVTDNPGPGLFSVAQDHIRSSPTVWLRTRCGLRNLSHGPALLAKASREQSQCAPFSTHFQFCSCHRAYFEYAYIS